MRDSVELIRSGRWSKLDHDNDVYSAIALLRMYRRVSLELSVSGDSDLVLQGERVVIPPSVEDSVIRAAHEGHLNSTKTERLLRERFWFPSMDS